MKSIPKPKINENKFKKYRDNKIEDYWNTNQTINDYY